MNTKLRNFLKTVFFPVVIIVRGYRRLLVSKSFVARRLFRYDRSRFLKYAGCFNGKEEESSLARVIMAYHVVEKGLTMPRRRLDFGHDAVINLIMCIENHIRNYGYDETQIKHAIGCIKEYYELHQESQFDMTQNPTFWERVKNFYDQNRDVVTSCQKSVHRKDFYKDKNAPFPLFASSRHTVRHFEGKVEYSRIEDSVKLAMTAPSACNRQYVKVYCVSNHSVRDKILSLQNGNRGFGSDADKLLVIVADQNGVRWPEERNDIYTNAGIFIMNLSYALHYNEIASCILNWSVSPVIDKKLRQLLDLKPSETLVAMLACGNAPEYMMIASSPRKDIIDILKETV